MSEILNSPGNYNILNIELLQLEPLNYSAQGRIECVFGYIYIFSLFKGVFRTQSNIYDENFLQTQSAVCRKPKKRLTERMTELRNFGSSVIIMVEVIYAVYCNPRIRQIYLISAAFSSIEFY